MSTQTTQPSQRSVVDSYPAAKAVVFAKSPVVTVTGPPAKTSSLAMTIQARVEHEMDENGDVYKKVVYDEANSSCAAAEIRTDSQPVSLGEDVPLRSSHKQPDCAAPAAKTEPTPKSEKEA